MKQLETLRKNNIPYTPQVSKRADLIRLSIWAFGSDAMCVILRIIHYTKLGQERYVKAGDCVRREGE